MIDLTEVADRWGDDHFKDFLHFNDAASDEWAALVAPRVAADSDIRRLHASHIGRTSMPTRVLQAAIVTDRPPEPLPAARDISVSLISPGVRGFGFVEGPYPQWTMPRPVRWLEGKHGEIRFTGGGGKSFILRMNVRSIAPDQKIEALVNGVPVVEHLFRKTDEWEAVVSREFTLAPENRLTFRATRAVRIGGRDLGVLFDEIAVREK